MTDSPDRDLKAHRFFHAMVLMGGSLALGCGGIGVESPTSSDSDDGGIDPVGGSSGGSGGSVGTGIGGAAGTPTSSGGSGGSDPSPLECPPAQWDCFEEVPDCDGYGFSLPDGCTCNELRPKSPSDCKEGYSFVCLDARRSADGSELAEPVPFSCTCMEEQPYCELNCDEVTWPGATCSQITDDAGETVLCGCAVVVLR